MQVAGAISFLGFAVIMVAGGTYVFSFTRQVKEWSKVLLAIGLLVFAGGFIALVIMQPK